MGRGPLRTSGGAGGLVRARLRGIDKSFAATRAVRGADLTLRAGEIQALLGENGAGKTTLMRILAGILRPDAGTIEIGGEVVALRGRMDGARHGVGLVQQHFGLVGELTGTENYLLGHPALRAWLPRARARAELTRAAEAFALAVDVDRPAAALTMGGRQRLEILIALVTGADVLILDEPTAALGSDDVAVLEGLLRTLSGRGKSVVYITHKLAEVMAFADRVTVMRRGRVVAEFERTEIETDVLTEAMVGDLPESVAVSRRPPGAVVLSARGISTPSAGTRCGLRDIDLAVHAHEIVGVAGVTGNGQEALAELLCGLAEPTAGAVDLRPDVVAYIPEDRARDALAMTLSLSDNAIVHRHRAPELRRGGRLRAAEVDHFVSEIVAAGSVQTPAFETPVSALSGGNQQKLVLAREIARAPALVVAHNPYRGLDVSASSDVRRRLLEARDRGTAIVLISPDLEDLFDIADRILVLSDGAFVGSVDPRTATAREIGALLGGA